MNSPECRHTFRASLHRRNACQDFTKSRMSPERRRSLCASRRSRIACHNFTRQSKRMSRFHKSHFIQKFTGKMLRPKTAPQTLCEPAQSKRMSRFHCDPKQHSYRVDGIGNRRREEVERRETLCASLRASQNEPRTRTAQNADIHVVRACPVETHVKISQEPLDTEIYRKNALPQNESRRQTNTLREPAQSNCMSKLHKTVETHVKISQEPLSTEIHRKNAAAQNRAADIV